LRVVSLLPAATDIIDALGAADSLVAITHECDAAVARDRTRVTSTPIVAGSAGAVDAQVRDTTLRGDSLFDLDEPTIAHLAPDVIVTQALCDVCAVSETDVRALAARLSPSPRLVTLSGTTIDTVLDDVRHVADALDLTDEGDELIAGLRCRLRHVERCVAAHLAHAKRPRLAVIEWTDPIFAAGHWMPEIVARAGGIDVLETAGRHSTQRTVDEVESAAPDVLIFAQCGYDAAHAAREAESVLRTDPWRWATDIPVWAIDANAYTSRPGPRLVDGVELVAKMLHRFDISGTHHAGIQRVDARR